MRRVSLRGEFLWKFCAHFVEPPIADRPDAELVGALPDVVDPSEEGAGAPNVDAPPGDVRCTLGEPVGAAVKDGDPGGVEPPTPFVCVPLDALAPLGEFCGGGSADVPEPSLVVGEGLLPPPLQSDTTTLSRSSCLISAATLGSVK